MNFCSMTSLYKASLARISVGIGCALSCGSALAACPSLTESARLTALYMNRQVLPAPDASMSMQDAQCARAQFNQFLTQQMGKVVGYKAGLTNPAVQKRFNYAEPVLGYLYHAMLLPNGAAIPSNFGARPVYEADLLVRVKDAGIHQAKTVADVIKHIDAIIPFIELPDLMVQDPTKLTGAGLVSINVGARAGVMGEAIKVSSAQLQQLADMQIVMLDTNMQEIERGKGSDILSHPLNAVIWIAQELKRNGQHLKPGDLLSLGSFSKLRPPQANQSITVRYEGLGNNPEVVVHFR